MSSLRNSLLILCMATAVLASAGFSSSVAAAEGGRGPSIGAGRPADEAKAVEKKPGETSPAVDQAATDKDKPADTEESLQRRMEWWKSLSDEDRARLTENYKRFEQLSDDEKRQIRERLSQLEKMTPEARNALHQRFERFHNMPQGDRQRIMEHTRAWRAMPLEKQMLVRRLLTVIRSLPPAEIDRLRKLPAEEKRQALRKLLEERGGEIEGAAPSGERGPRAIPRDRAERIGERRGPQRRDSGWDDMRRGRQRSANGDYEPGPQE